MPDKKASGTGTGQDIPISLTGILNEERNNPALHPHDRLMLRNIDTAEANLALRDMEYLAGEPRNWHVTKKGADAGITEELRHRDDGESYTVILYSQSARETIVPELLKHLRGDEDGRDAEISVFFEIEPALIDDEGGITEQAEDDSSHQKFFEKWRHRFDSPTTPLDKLLGSSSEDSFFGAVAHGRYMGLTYFTNDLAEALLERDLIENSIIDSRIEVPCELFVDIWQIYSEYDIENRRPNINYFPGKYSEDFPPRKLITVFGIDWLLENAPQTEEDRIRYEGVLDLFRRQLPQRYVVLTGSKDEIERFCSLDAQLNQSFGNNTVSLISFETDAIAKRFMELLDPKVRSKADADESFHGRLLRHIAFNLDKVDKDKRSQYADILAEYANEAQRPVLKVPEGGYDSVAIQRELDDIIGMHAVKKTFRELEDSVFFERRTGISPIKGESAFRHMVFAGNPGTGKTMMARLIAELLPKIGAIDVPKGRVAKYTEVSANDLFGTHVGESEEKTASVLEKARGGVLFIDEAYAILNHVGVESDVTANVVAILVKKLEEYRNDLVVIFAGYAREMNRLMESNPGLRSRIGFVFSFDDYSTDELMELFDRRMRRTRYRCNNEEARAKLRHLFDRNRSFTDFGNGRFVQNVADIAQRKHASAVASSDIPEDRLFSLTPEDIPDQNELTGASDWSFKHADELLEPLVGLHDLKLKICAFEKEVGFREAMRKAGKPLPERSMHMLLTGDPGTGKTTVARIIGKILYNVGVLPTNKFIEVEARSLAMGVQGKEPEVARYLRDAMGGVLFVDEAYALLAQRNADDIIATLVKAMEDHKGDFVIIFAGYSMEMHEFTRKNPGLESRIGYSFHFPNYSAQELQEIFERKVKGAGLSLTEEAKDASQEVFDFFQSVDRFGNGRFVDRLFDNTIARHAISYTPETLTKIDACDIPTVEDMCAVVAVPVSYPGNPSDEELKRTGVHELGHAICCKDLSGSSSIASISIEAEGDGSIGRTVYMQSSFSNTREGLLNTISATLGGTVAEDLVLGDTSVGCRDDLSKATLYAYEYVALYGFSDLGLVQYDFKSIGDLPQEVRDEMRKVLERARELARDTIKCHRGVLDAALEQLLEKGNLSGDEFDRIWDDIEGVEYEVEDQ